MIIKSTQRKRMYFEGDSISYNFAQYLSRTVTTSLISSKGIVSTFDYAVSGSTIADLTTRFATWGGSIKGGDIIHLWVGTNDIWLSSHSAATTYSDLCVYAQLIRNKGAKIVMSTMVARETDATKETTRLAYNALIRGGTGFVFDAIADVGSDVVFDTSADTADTTYYVADRIHPNTVGLDVAATTYIIPAISSIW